MFAKKILVPGRATARMKLKICTEADYLQAHITAIEGEDRGRKPTLHDGKQQVLSALKTLLSAANAMWCFIATARRSEFLRPKVWPGKLSNISRFFG